MGWLPDIRGQGGDISKEGQQHSPRFFGFHLGFRFFWHLTEPPRGGFRLVRGSSISSWLILRIL